MTDQEQKLGQGGKEQEGQNAEKQYRARQYFKEGQTQIEVLSTSVKKEQLIDSARTFVANYEDMSLHRDGSVSEYRLDDAIALIGNRALDMSYLFRDLVELGYIDPDPTKYNAKTTEAEFAFPGFSYESKTELRPHGSRGIYDTEGRLIRTEVEQEPTQVFLVGEDGQRKALSINLREVQAEMTAREDLVKMLRWVWNNTENLEGLVNFYLFGSLTNEAMGLLCNAEGRKGLLFKNEQGGSERHEFGLTRTEGRAEFREGHEFGDAMSAALQCFEIAALSEKPAELENLLKRPGIRFLFNVSDRDIDDIFLPPEKRNNRQLNPILTKWIGEPWRWSRNINGIKKNVNNEQDSRGLLTNKGNILVESSWGDAEIIFQQIERFLGGGDKAPNLLKKDARDARFIAWGLLRITGMASDLGGQLYNQPCVDGIVREVVSHDLGGMTSCDRVKVIAPNIFRWVYRYLKPEIRFHGPDGSLGEYPDRFTIPYFKSWTGDNKNGAKRSFQELRWGYRKGKEKDFLTGREVELPEEVAYRLGELPWDKLTPKAYNGAALGPYIAGREKIGLFTIMKRTDWDIHELKDDGFAKGLANYLGIAMNAQTVFDGKFRGIYDGVREKSKHSRDLSDEDKKDPKKVNQAGLSDALEEKVKDEIRNYKKKFFYAWWDGLRSLPQWREWRALASDLLDKEGRNIVHPLERVRYHLGTVMILTPREASKLPLEALSENNKS